MHIGSDSSSDSSSSSSSSDSSPDADWFSSFSVVSGDSSYSDPMSISGDSSLLYFVVDLRLVEVGCGDRPESVLCGVPRSGSTVLLWLRVWDPGDNPFPESASIFNLEARVGMDFSSVLSFDFRSAELFLGMALCECFESHPRF